MSVGVAEASVKENSQVNTQPAVAISYWPLSTELLDETEVKTTAGYLRKLHQKIDELQTKGVKVSTEQDSQAVGSDRRERVDITWEQLENGGKKIHRGMKACSAE
jgi:hypothetical protein